MRGVGLALGLLLIGSCLYAQVSIKGTAPAYPAKTISLYIYNDYITYQEREIAQAQIDENGNFSLKAQVEETQYAFLRIDNELADFFIEKNGDYVVKFPEPKVQETSVNEFVERNFHRLEITNSTWYSLNPSLVRLNNLYDDFLENNVYLLMRQSTRDKKKLVDNINAFRKDINEKFNAVHGEFFETYVNYAFANIRQITMLPEERLYEEYFKDQAIHYRNLEYMNFFHSFFEKKVELFAISNKGSKLVHAINASASLDFIDGVLTENEFLQDKHLRRLALIKACQNFFHDKEFKKGKVANLLEKIEQENLHPEIALAAKTMRTELVRLAPGNPAPEIELRNSNNIPTKLSDFRGKYIYLEFTDATCPACNAETMLVKELKREFGNKIEFVTVLVNEDFEIAREYIQANDYNWTFLISGRESKVLKDYNIKSVPSYYLIDKDFKLLLSPAQNPSHHADLPEKNIKYILHKLK